MLEQIWEKLKKRLIRKLLTDPHTALLRGGYSGSVIKLKYETKISGQLFVESRIIYRSIRLMAPVSFQMLKGEWTKHRDAIIDTGSHVSIIPRYIWTNAYHSFISDETENRDRPLEDSVGEVISTNENEIKVKTREGDVVTFKIPYRETDDGEKVLNDDFVDFAKSLDKSARVKILWYKKDEHRFIHRIEKVKE